MAQQNRRTPTEIPTPERRPAKLRAFSCGYSFTNGELNLRTTIGPERTRDNTSSLRPERRSLESVPWHHANRPLGVDHIAATVAQMISKHAKLSANHFAVACMNSELGAGGTGIEPATCGFGDPIRCVGECRTPSPHAALPHYLCRLMSPNVAVYRRSLGQILGQLILPWALFSPI